MHYISEIKICMNNNNLLSTFVIRQDISSLGTSLVYDPIISNIEDSLSDLRAHNTRKDIIYTYQL